MKKSYSKSFEGKGLWTWLIVPCWNLILEELVKAQILNIMSSSCHHHVISFFPYIFPTTVSGWPKNCVPPVPRHFMNGYEAHEAAEKIKKATGPTTTAVAQEFGRSKWTVTCIDSNIGDFLGDYSWFVHQLFRAARQVVPWNWSWDH